MKLFFALAIVLACKFVRPDLLEVYEDENSDPTIEYEEENQDPIPDTDVQKDAAPYKWMIGDAQRRMIGHRYIGGEYHIPNQPSREACYRACIREQRSDTKINGVTYGASRRYKGTCLCKWGMKSYANGDKNWISKVIPAYSFKRLTPSSSRTPSKVAKGSYKTVGKGRCSTWGNKQWIMTSDAESETDRGSSGHSNEECQKKCSSQSECKFAIASNDGRGWCYLWKGESCPSKGPYGKYVIFEKTQKQAAPLTSSKDKWMVGDGVGGGEFQISPNIRSRKACYVLCYSKQRSYTKINGVTYGVSGSNKKHCYCELGMKSSNGNKKYVSKRIPAAPLTSSKDKWWMVGDGVGGGEFQIAVNVRSRKACYVLCYSKQRFNTKINGVTYGVSGSNKKHCYCEWGMKSSNGNKKYVSKLIPALGASSGNRLPKPKPKKPKHAVQKWGPPNLSGRNKGRCGSRYRADCSTTKKPTGWKSVAPCCSRWGWCGGSRYHCSCHGCTDFRKPISRHRYPPRKSIRRKSRRHMRW